MVHCVDLVSVSDRLSKYQLIQEAEVALHLIVVPDLVDPLREVLELLQVQLLRLPLGSVDLVVVE